MRLGLIAAAFLCVVLAGSMTLAADAGQVSNDTLSMMGVGGLQPMTDVQGTSVRGKSSWVGGLGYATTGLSFSFNRYGNPTPYLFQASGNNNSQAAITFFNVSVFGAVSGGSSMASGR